MKKSLFLSVIFLLAFFLLRSNTVFAQAVYPVPELGNCRDANECYLYCQLPQNTPACWSYGKYILHKQVLAESDEDLAKKHGITFPIAELGNCANINQCKAYCDNPSNHDACMSFAKKKGFHKEVGDQSGGNPELLASARSELGCDSETSCQALCEQPTNRERCMAFAQKHGLGRPPPDKVQLLQAAQAELGCTSMETCRATCEQQKDKCMEFARKHGLGGGPSGGSQQQGPGGCNSEETCRAYCQTHPDECKGFAATSGDANYSGSYKQGDYLGPGGCKTEEECKNYCSSHPSECPGFQQGQPSYQQQPVGSYPTYYPQPTYTYQPQPTYSYEQPQSYPTYQPTQEQYQQYQTPQTQPNPTP